MSFFVLEIKTNALKDPISCAQFFSNFGTIRSVFHYLDEQIG